jgi:hypothetical protein
MKVLKVPCIGLFWGLMNSLISGIFSRGLGDLDSIGMSGLGGLIFLENDEKGGRFFLSDFLKLLLMKERSLLEFLALVSKSGAP